MLNLNTHFTPKPLHSLWNQITTWPLSDWNRIMPAHWLKSNCIMPALESKSNLSILWFRWNLVMAVLWSKLGWNGILLLWTIWILISCGLSLFDCVATNRLAVCIRLWYDSDVAVIQCFLLIQLWCNALFSFDCDSTLSFHLFLLSSPSIKLYLNN